MMKYIVLFFWLICCCEFVHAQEIINSSQKLENINLKEGFAYDGFTANDHYLAWAELYTSTIHIYDLRKKEVQKIKLQKGKGPFEVVQMSAIGLTKEDQLIINDIGNIKIIRYDLIHNEYVDEFKIEDARPFKVEVYDNNIMYLDNNASVSLYHFLKVEKDWSVEKFNMGNYGVDSEFSYTFKRDGYIDNGRKFGVHITSYYPNIYVIDKNKKKVVRKIAFDQSNTEKGKKITYQNQKAFKAPEEFDLENSGIAFMPGSTNKVLFLTIGIGEKRKYIPSRLQLIDISTGNPSIQQIDIGIKATNITSNNDNLFVYSKEENAVYSYEVANR